MKEMKKKVFTFGTDIFLDSRMNWADFDGQIQMVKVTVTSQKNIFRQKPRIHATIMTKFHPNVESDEMMTCSGLKVLTVWEKKKKRVPMGFVFNVV